MRLSSWDKSIFIFPVCCLQQLFAVTVVFAAFPEFWSCFWRSQDILKTSQVVWDKVTSHFHEEQSSWVKTHFLRLCSHKQDRFTTQSRTQTIIQPHLKKLDLAFVLLPSLHPIDDSKCSSKLALNACEKMILHIFGWRQTVKMTLLKPLRSINLQ